MRKSRILLMSLAILIIPFSVLAAAGVGDKIPHDLAVKDQDQKPQSFESVKGENGAVLVFIRSADWCPYCQAQLIELGDNADKITELGYSLVTISYDAPEKLKAFRDKYEYGYTMLSDPASEIIRAFGILNEDIAVGTSYYGIPHPAVFIVNAQGVIQSRLMEEDYKNRPPVEDIVEAIKTNLPPPAPMASDAETVPEDPEPAPVPSIEEEAEMAPAAGSESP